MLDNDNAQNSAPETAAADSGTPVVKTTTRKRATRSTAKKAAPAPESAGNTDATADAPAAEDAPVVKTTTRKTAAKKTAAKKTAAKKAPAKKTAAKKTTAKKATAAVDDAQATLDLGAEAIAAETSEKPVVKKTTRKRAVKKVAAPVETALAETAPAETALVETAPVETAPVETTPAKKTAAKRTRKTAAKKVAAPAEAAVESPTAEQAAPEATEAAAPVVKKTTRKRAAKKVAAPVEFAAEQAPEVKEAPEAPAAPMALFQVPAAEPKVTTRRRSTRKVAAVEVPAEPTVEEVEEEVLDVEAEVASDAAAATLENEADANVEATEDDTESDEDEENSANGRRRRRRGGRRRRRSGGSDSEQDEAESKDADEDSESEASESDNDSDAAESGSGSSRRRRRRRRAGDSDSENGDDPENTVTRVRKTRALEDQITAVSGSTRLEAKKQRRREGREAGRRRAPIISEAEFLARREAVDRQMVIRQREELTQIGVIEDKVLVEHYVARESQTSMIGNVYLGKVQNVLPSMEAAFIDIGKGRNAVLYAGEVNWAALGHKDGQARKIESVLSSGQSILVQVTKDPIGHKGARLTSQVSLAGRFLVYVPDGTNSGISRKLPDTERSRLKKLLKEIVPEHAGVIVRTAAEGASEEELTQDVERLKARWADIEAKAGGGAQGPKLLYGEPDLTLKVVRDLFTEDFSKLVIEGDEAWNTVQDYVQHVAPDLVERVEKFSSPTEGKDEGKDIFGVYRIEEQIQKGLDRKVWLPSGGSLIIDRTEAMTVIDVNTGKFTGSGGNLEETVTKNNLEAAEEVVRQLRLRDIGGIIVVDFIDMVLESNRDLVVRRLVECLGRDRTRHQVAEVTSLGLVQMTRKRIGTGLLETFGVDCDHCHGRGMVISDQPVEPRRSPAEDDQRRGGRNRRGKGRDQAEQASETDSAPSPDTTEAVEAVEETRNEGGRSGRNRRRNGRNDRTPSPADVAAAHPNEEVADEPQTVVEDAVVEVVDPLIEAPVVETAEVVEAVESAPAAAKVTRRSRRRANVIVVTPSEPVAPAVVPEVTPQETPVVVETAALAPVEAVAEAPEAGPEEPVASSTPKVVTRTRRRSANRPAGPPAAETTPQAPADEADKSSDATGENSSSAASEAVAHVPLKKKGARKR